MALEVSGRQLGFLGGTLGDSLWNGDGCLLGLGVISRFLAAERGILNQLATLQQLQLAYGHNNSIVERFHSTRRPLVDAKAFAMGIQARARDTKLSLSNLLGFAIVGLNLLQSEKRSKEGGHERNELRPHELLFMRMEVGIPEHARSSLSNYDQSSEDILEK